MYAIFETGGKQYKVSAGDVLKIEKIEGAAGDQVQFGNVIAFSGDDGSIRMGTPYLDATVNTTILSEGKGKKVIIFKFKSKKDYRKKQGHRQPYTEIEVDNFTIDGVEVGEKPEKPVAEAEEKIEAAPAVEAAADEKPSKKKAKKAEDEVVEVDEVVEEEADAEDEAVSEDEAVAEEETAAEAEEGAVDAEAEEGAVDDEAAPEADEEIAEDETTETDEEAGSKKGMTKADIIAKLDELGIEHLKSAKKEELLELLEGAENK